jgi:hypothetical protein
MRPALVRFVLLPALVLPVACGPSTADFDLRLREMAGCSERELLGSMGRIPDNFYQLDDETKILQWRWDTSYVSPGMAPMYQRFGRTWMAVGGSQPTLVRQGCIVEWTVSNGATRGYRWQGNGCRSVILAGPP